MKIQVVKSKGQWFARVKADNGKTLFTSETYKQKRSALKAVYLLHDVMWHNLENLQFIEAK